MDTQTEFLLQQALELGESDRAAIAASLFQSLDMEADSDADAAWAVEIERRIGSVNSGDATLLPWDSVMQEMRERRNG